MSRARILVIDDDPLFRSLLTSMLRQEFLVTAASDGAEGYYRALERPPHLAIVDIRMPGWDGLRTLKAFRAHHLLARIPMMMLTSDASRQTVLAALQAGADDYVIKTTLARDDFLRKVCRQLNFLSIDGSVSDAFADFAPGEAERAKSAGNVASRQQDRLAVMKPIDPRSDRPFDDAALEPLIDDWE